MDRIALLLAVISLAVAVGMAYWQYRTEKNTMKITPDGQIGLLIDYIRHFYANLLVTEALRQKTGGRYDTHYPSEEHIRKLAVDTEALHPDAFYTMKHQYNSIHELLILIRNYNIEIETAEIHLCSQDVPGRFKERDFGTLVFKPNFIAMKAFNCIKAIRNSDEEKFKSIICDELTRHAVSRIEGNDEIKQQIKEIRSKLSETEKELLEINLSNAKKSEKKTEEERLRKEQKELNEQIFKIKKDFIDNESNYNKTLRLLNMEEKDIARIANNFAKLFFNGNETTLYHLLAADIYEEINKTNSQGFETLCIMPFTKSKQ